LPLVPRENEKNEDQKWYMAKSRNKNGKGAEEVVLLTSWKSDCLHTVGGREFSEARTFSCHAMLNYVRCQVEGVIQFSWPKVLQPGAAD